MVDFEKFGKRLTKEDIYNTYCAFFKGGWGIVMVGNFIYIKDWQGMVYYLHLWKIKY